MDAVSGWLDAERLVAEVTETALPSVSIGQAVEIVPETDQSKAYPGKVLRRELRALCLI